MNLQHASLWCRVSGAAGAKLRLNDPAEQHKLDSSGAFCAHSADFPRRTFPGIFQKEKGGRLNVRVLLGLLILKMPFWDISVDTLLYFPSHFSFFFFLFNSRLLHPKSTRNEDEGFLQFPGEYECSHLWSVMESWIIM